MPLPVHAGRFACRGRGRCSASSGASPVTDASEPSTPCAPASSTGLPSCPDGDHRGARPALGKATARLDRLARVRKRVLCLGAGPVGSSHVGSSLCPGPYPRQPVPWWVRRWAPGSARQHHHCPCRHRHRHRRAAGPPAGMAALTKLGLRFSSGCARPAAPARADRRHAPRRLFPVHGSGRTTQDGSIAIGERSILCKNKAAFDRRPESREETPKEGVAAQQPYWANSLNANSVQSKVPACVPAFS